MTVRAVLGRVLESIAERLNPPPMIAQPVPVHRFRFNDPEPTPEPFVMAEGYDVEMTVSLHSLSGIFGAHGWQLSRPGRGPQPSAPDIADVLADMVLTVDHTRDEPDAFFQFARFVAVRSSDWPDDVDLYLHVGTATRQGDDATDLTIEDL